MCVIGLLYILSVSFDFQRVCGGWGDCSIYHLCGFSMYGGWTCLVYVLSMCHGSVYVEVVDTVMGHMYHMCACIGRWVGGLMGRNEGRT